MKMELPDIPADERTPLVETLLAIIRVQQDRIQQLEETVQQLRDEIAILKGQKPRPDIKPSVLEARQPKTAGQEGSKRPGSAKRPKTAELHIHHEVPLHPEGRRRRCQGDRKEHEVPLEGHEPIDPAGDDGLVRASWPNSGKA